MVRNLFNNTRCLHWKCWSKIIHLANHFMEANIVSTRFWFKIHRIGEATKLPGIKLIQYNINCKRIKILFGFCIMCFMCTKGSNTHFMIWKKNTNSTYSAWQNICALVLKHFSTNALMFCQALVSNCKSPCHAMQSTLCFLDMSHETIQKKVKMVQFCTIIIIHDMTLVKEHTYYCYVQERKMIELWNGNTQK